MSPARLPIISITLALMACAAAAQAAPRRVLLLYSYEREFSHRTFARLFRTELVQTSPEPVDFVELTLQTVRASRTESDPAVLDDLRATLAGRRLDLVVTLGGPAARLAQKNRDQLFSDTPLLIAAADSRFVEGQPLAANQTALTVRNDPTRMLESMLELLPETRTIVVIIGASRLEQFWLEEVQRAFRPFEKRVQFIWTNTLSFAELVQRCATLPGNSAILYGIWSLDAAGVPQIEEHVLDAIHAAANAPMFGLHSHQLGHGIVGGALLSLEDISRDTATVALRLLDGEPAANIPPRTFVASTAIFDARELRRWRIMERRLQPGSIVRFRETGSQYRGATVTAAAFAGAQAVLLLALTSGLLRRRRASLAASALAASEVSTVEAALARLAHRLMRGQEAERASMAATLHDDVGQQLTGLKMRLQALPGSPNPANVELRRRVEDLCDQFSELERQLAALSDPLYSRLQTLGLIVSARAFCQRVCNQHAIHLAFTSDDIPVRLPDGLRLAFFRVLQDAMENAVTHAGTSRISVSITKRHQSIELEVADHGRGFDPETALRAGAVGLIGMRERMRLVGGECTIESRPGAGTRIRARAPLEAGSREPKAGS